MAANDTVPSLPSDKIQNEAPERPYRRTPSHYDTDRLPLRDPRAIQAAIVLDATRSEDQVAAARVAIATARRAETAERIKAMRASGYHW